MAKHADGANQTSDKELQYSNSILETFYFRSDAMKYVSNFTAFEFDEIWSMVKSHMSKNWASIEDLSHLKVKKNYCS